MSHYCDVRSWNSAGDVLHNNPPSFPSTGEKSAIVIDSLSHLILSLSADHVCQVLNRLCRHTESRFFTVHIILT